MSASPNTLGNTSSNESLVPLLGTHPRDSVQSSQQSQATAIEHESLEPTIVANVPLNLQHSDGLFFSTSMPQEMESLIGSQLFTARIQQLNDSLKPYSKRRNYGPIIRYIALIILSSFTMSTYIVFDSTLYLIACICISMCIMGGVADLTFTKQDFENVIIAQLNSFNQEDDSIKLVWRLQPHGTEPFFNLVPVPFLRQISVKFVSKGGEGDEFLPEYQVEFTLFGASEVLSADVENGLPAYDEASG
ncbi:hypothetical protein BCR33DRAFT_717321 [Rhizoclosmatium globosum]|uniref:Transmembrane protein n=1 Tax=Rhizoclosmatium globosum TaxID=329046 RepID=A0A1Y2CBC8_9FUNG|nr:hypothetical protein BCR33DRAFT_717321 [Rhizoclosmatium globosum]|eukprot:ORY43635.1 hypothetical protein BCR33DRAFT_717321 [Rhizoclosmatium globosum]